MKLATDPPQSLPPSLLSPSAEAYVMSIVTIRVSTIRACRGLVELKLSTQNVEFLNNPARFLDPYHFRVTFECIAPLPEGDHGQILDIGGIR